MSIRYRIVNDDSSQDYIIPVDKLEEWNNFLYSENWELGITPSWAQCIDNINSLTFEEPYWRS